MVRAGFEGPSDRERGGGGKKGEAARPTPFGREHANSLVQEGKRRSSREPHPRCRKIEKRREGGGAECAIRLIDEKKRSPLLSKK